MLTNSLILVGKACDYRVSLYRQISGGRFLIGLREMQSSQRILACRSLLKIGDDIWNVCEDDQENDFLEEFMQQLADRDLEIKEAFLCKDSVEVAQCIACYTAKKNPSKDKCSSKIISENCNGANDFVNVLS